MKSFKTRTTGRDMVSDIVLAGYDAGVKETKECPECEEGSNLNEERTICFNCTALTSCDTLRPLED